MIVLIFVFMIIIVMLGGFTAMNSKSAKKPPVPNLELLSNKPKAATSSELSTTSSELNTPGTYTEEEEEPELNTQQKEVPEKMNNLIFNLEDVDEDHVEELIVSSEIFQTKPIE